MVLTIPAIIHEPLRVLLEATDVWPRVSLRVTGRLSTRVSSLPSTPRMPDWVLGLVLPPPRGQKVGGEVLGTSLRHPLQWSHARCTKLPEQHVFSGVQQGCVSHCPGFLQGASPMSTLCPTPTHTPGSQENSRSPVLAPLSVHTV